MTQLATALDETPVVFVAAGEELFGVVTRPPGPARGIGVLLLSGGVWTPSPGRNRIWVRLARELAGDGFHVLRFDYHGVGESTGSVTTYTLSEPFADDVVAAAEVLRTHGAPDLVVFGTCFGSRSAMAAAPRLSNLRGAAFFPAALREFEMGEQYTTRPASWYVRRLLRPRAVRLLRDPDKRGAYVALVKARIARSRRRSSAPAVGDGFRWVSKTFVDELRHLAGRRVPVLLVFGRGDSFYEDFTRGRSGPLGAVLDEAGSLIEIAELDGKVHGLTRSAVQDDVVATLHRWLRAAAASDVTRARS
jgi:pimeloyl-ACP methyl ester carboxylesterase